ncbi:hypothetical protein D3C86_1918620 [compost metagenome]
MIESCGENDAACIAFEAFEQIKTSFILQPDVQKEDIRFPGCQETVCFIDCLRITGHFNLRTMRFQRQSQIVHSIDLIVDNEAPDRPYDSHLDNII